MEGDATESFIWEASLSGELDKVKKEGKMEKEEKNPEPDREGEVRRLLELSGDSLE